MKILAIDTATEACSVSLLNDGYCQEIFEVIPRQHTERVLPMVDEILKKADVTLSQLSAVAFNSGPGSFTGVRVGTSVAQGLAFSCDLPVIPVSSLAALAQLAFREENKEQILSAIDARMAEVYWGCYQLESGIMRLIGKEHVSPVAEIKQTGQWHCQGSGWDTFKTELEQSNLVNVTSSTLNCFPHAQDIAILAADMFQQGKMVSAEDAIPSYIRDEVTWKKIKDQ
ncbi:MAG: tRNA (adenosine(37)-N6)-threonylcarbamoyltransferase complex dimerization subunit type 1 TsaB [Gammaproteobacteria bacterium]|nr:tRNA (adenosine(37)-N6)-threonylcarbamoyltransferase complex dimerization subunit type 1 TsaB [Gammaproteobacteria bacterium]MCW8987820.1 tRNA (adenosine(37)-N6)-threonylcarbamoyltransferase complex dimerization subunit type 1 TsaB [Gammaproteobacteria bacterium]MCW9030504.1 tRNA (adenosine(37)-N6)-threonylcarbamoyltransferase complex dimerization subunit type 1 TsaB [Gammaproteobacteria bacterium]